MAVGVVLAMTGWVFVVVGFFAVAVFFVVVVVSAVAVFFVAVVVVFAVAVLGLGVDLRAHQCFLAGLSAHAST